MLSRSRSTIQSAQVDSVFFSASMNKEVEIRVLNHSENMSYCLILPLLKNKATLPRVLPLIAESAVRKSSISITVDAVCARDFPGVEDEIRQHLVSRSPFILM